MYCPELYLIEEYNPENWRQLFDADIIYEIPSHNLKPYVLSDFIKDPSITNLFLIIVGIGTIISLLPIFLDFFFSPNWLNILLKNMFGFFTLLLILIAVFTGVIFMMIVTMYIAYEFYIGVIKQKYTIIDKFFSSFYMVVFLVSLFSICLILLNVWVIMALAKFNFILSLSIFFISLILGIFFIISGEVILIDQITRTGLNSKIISGYLSSFAAHLRKYNIRSGVWKFLQILSLILLILVVGYLLFLIISPPFSLVTNYYNDTEKHIEINMWYNESISRNNSPLILPLHYSPENATNLGILDEYYLDCHWSTNYGYFLEMRKDFSQIKRAGNELTISVCPNSTDNIFWTYDAAEFGKSKPDFFIGLSFNDINKETTLGRSHLNLSWKDYDVIEKDTSKKNRTIEPI
jgi:hypothetical protein